MLNAFEIFNTPDLATRFLMLTDKHQKEILQRCALKLKLNQFCQWSPTLKPEQKPEATKQDGQGRTPIVADITKHHLSKRGEMVTT